MTISFRTIAAQASTQQSSTDSLSSLVLAAARGRGKGLENAPGFQKHQAAAPPPAPPTAEPPAADPAAPPPVSTSPQELSIDQLAELYVKQYEEGSGVTLSSDAFKQRKAEVAAFYSGISGGTARLDAVVFANDGNSSDPSK